MQFENSSRLRPRHASGFSKPESTPSFDSTLDKEHDAGSHKIVSEERGSKQYGSSGLMKDGDAVNVKAQSFRSTTSTSPSSEPITETTVTNVSCVATPTVDKDGRPIIETVTKTQREVNGQPLPAETIHSKIPLEEIQALQQQQQLGGLQQPLLQQEDQSMSSLPRQRKSSLKSQAKSAANQIQSQAKITADQIQSSETYQKAKVQGQEAFETAKVKGSDALDQAKEQIPLMASAAQAKGAEVLTQAKQWVDETAPVAKAWVNENAPKAKEVLLQGAAATQEWVNDNAPKAKEAIIQGANVTQVWVQDNAPKARRWALRTMDDLKLRLRQVDTIKLRRQLRDLAPLLASLLIALALGSYLYRHGGNMGLKASHEQLVPISEVRNHPVDSFTIYPQTRDYYQHSHTPERVNTLETQAEHLKNKAKITLDSASSTLHSAADSASTTLQTAAEKASIAAQRAGHYVQDQAAQAKEFVQDKAADLSENVRHGSEEAKIRVAEMKEQAAHRAHQAHNRAHHHVREASREGATTWQGVKDSAANMAADAKGKLFEARDSAADLGRNAQLRAEDMAGHAKLRMNQAADAHTHTQTVETNVPPHSHTYPHTLGGAADYLKDKVGEGLDALGRRAPQAGPTL